ncbi:MAG: glycoside hydrolase, partial [Planctomycetota bacterium]
MNLIGWDKGDHIWSPLRKMAAILLVGLLVCVCQAAEQRLTIANSKISVTLNSADATFSVTDKRTGQTWRQRPSDKFKVINCKRVEGGLEMTCRHQWYGLDSKTTLRLDGDKPELTLELSAEGKLKGALGFPYPFISESGDYLVIPMNEGISYPVDDATVKSRWLIAYGGHGICMAFWGVTNGDSGHMAIIETPDDAVIHINRIDGKLCVAPKWERQKGEFGYARKLRYVFLDKGGHVAMCKRYRRHAEQIGKLKTLEQKRRENPNVDLLIGAVNIWCWDRDALPLVREAKSLGIERILWSRRQPPGVVEAMNKMDGVLTSRYEIYQDLMDPQIVRDKLRSLHPDWTQAAWPADIMLDEKGEPRQGWRVKGKDGRMYPCAVLCDKQAPKYAADRVPAELKTHRYRSRFIDTTTASPWRECYHPDHPMSRSESRHWKMELLRFVSEKTNLVTGCETGHDAAVPYVHYFEGMLSLGPYRIPDAGRDMGRIWDEVPERVARFQVGHKYRLP